MSSIRQTLIRVAVALVTAFLLICIGGLITYFPIKRHFQAELDALKPSEVQVIKRDTIRLYLPSEIEYRVTRDTIAVHDTTFCKDTIFLPREQRVYADSSYRAVVSGISPRLDSIEVYQRTIEITKFATRKEWRKFDYGVQVGFGLVRPINNSLSFGFYGGFGITYHF